MFSIQGRVKEHNLTYLQHLQTAKQYILRESVFNEETEELDMLTKLKERQGFSHPHLTNLISISINTQNTSMLRKKIFVQNITGCIACGIIQEGL